MGAILRQLLDDWGEGVVTSMEPDAIPPKAYSHGYNAALTSIGSGKAVVMKRKGMRLLNATQVTGATAVVGQHEFRLLSGGSFTPHHLLVSDSGRLDRVSTGGALTVISATAFTSSSSQEHLPAFADAQNLCFIVNGVEAKKYDGTTLSTFGIVEPSTAPTLADSGVAGSHNGTYEARVTYANSTTGAESSAGPTSSTVTVANKKINWTAIPVSADAQVNRRYLYMRNTATQSNFYLAATISDNVTTTAQTNLLDSSLVDIGPDTDENDPPPAGIKYVAWHRSRMFVADDTNIYYSKIEEPEAFDPEAFEPVNPDDGQKITGIYSAFDVLIILKSRSIYALVGSDPELWTIRIIDANIGCAAHRSIVYAGGVLHWWGDKGPAAWDGSANPLWIGPPLIQPTVSAENLSHDATAMARICAAHEVANDRVLFAVPELSQTRNTLILPWNHRLRRWESDGWDPVDIASLAAVDDSSGAAHVSVGGYAGQAFIWWDATNDGVASGTSSGTFVAASGSITTVTDLTAAFDTVGGKLTERKVTIVDSNGQLTDTVRPRITSNTATSFTMVSSVGGLTSGLTYTYYIGGPAFDWYSPWLLHDDPLSKKRYMFLFLQLRPVNSISGVKIDTYVNYNLNPTTARSQTFSVDVDTGQWDVSLWDDAIWDSALADTSRVRVGRTGISFLARIRHYAPDSEFDLLKLAVTAEMLTDRIG